MSTSEQPRSESSHERFALIVRGLVQGVGFRPFVHRLATEAGLSGLVRNRADGAWIEVEGPPERIRRFAAKVRASCPAPASIEHLEATQLTPIGGARGFRIDESDTASPGPPFFSPDLATCAECVRELFDPSDRRHRYPFINCARCGPRLTIANSAPYDRERTTMAAFAICERCRAEYDDPHDRRFHAQPIACPDCGPRLRAHDAEGNVLEIEPLALFAAAIRAGRIVAVKGIGGYHLACDATSELALERLRARKLRDQKPFALLARDLGAARGIARISDAEAALLESSARPIVLLHRLAGASIARGVAPGSRTLGLMLPYTPLHHLLARSVEVPLVLTSANRSEEPLAFDDGEALVRLRTIADAFLTHDRAIRVRCDDSVTRIVAGRPRVLRRSRGYAPSPIALPVPAARPILALGGHLKSAFALGRGGHAVLGHHIGDLGEAHTLRAFRDAVAHYEALFAFAPEILAHDLHPGYATTEYALARAAREGMQLVAVQHHHAHMASCMAEHGLSRPVIAIAFDGSGYGSDHTIWGGEVLVGDYSGFRRAACLRAVRLAGGEAAVREPWRIAAAHLLDCGEDPSALLRSVPPADLRFVLRIIERGVHSPFASSAGRLFDAIAALVCERHRVSFEAQAAIELESLAAASEPCGSYPFELASEPETRLLVLDTRPIVRAIVAELRAGEPRARIARRFHDTIAEIALAAALRLRDETGIDDVVLTGGVFQNAILLEAASARLEASGLGVHAHSRVPSNDGGLALGQLAVAAAMIAGRS